jgi:membrane associated rhomboid family serine protease
MAIPVHIALMVTTALAFGAQSTAPKVAMAAGARMNAAVINGQWHRMVSPVFLHGGAMHLLSNLFSLWRVGPLVESSFGPARTILLYLLSGVGGTLAGLAFGSPRVTSVGASGAVFGMMGAAGGFVLRNKRTLGTYGDMVLTNVGQVLLLNLFIGTRRGSGIDNLAHVGGFVSGALLGILMAPSAGGRSYDRYNDEVQAEPKGDGSLLPSWAIRGLLAATAAAYVLGIRDALSMAGTMVRIYGRI